jgi:hypothetical protein
MIKYPICLFTVQDNEKESTWYISSVKDKKKKKPDTKQLYKRKEYNSRSVHKGA